MAAVDSVRDGVVSALRGAFPSCAVYCSPVEQGATPPCFFVSWTGSSEEHVTGNFYWREYSFDVDYFAPEGSRDEAVADELFDVLEVIRLCPGQSLRASSMRADARLVPFTMSVSYRVKVTKGVAAGMIRSYSLEGGVN